MQDLIDTLPPVSRLALSYAPGETHARWLTLLALDERLAGVVRAVLKGERDPIMAQFRLAWWRDRLREASAEWPKGEPLLAALACWQDSHGALGALVDGWEALLAETPDAEAWIAGRVAACEALHEAAGPMARGWAVGDLAALGLSVEHEWASQPLPRSMRPLVVLHGLAARGRREHTPATLFTAIRLGILGR